VVEFQRLVLRRSREPYFCLDASKLSSSAPEFLAAWQHVPYLVTDASLAALIKAGIPLSHEHLVMPARRSS
jgi:DeoR/GlpR family transcriptional regulator of sugar metabolism